MIDLYPWIVLVHIVGAFLFALTHGVSSAVAIALRKERDLARVQTLLDLSRAMSGTLYLGLLLLLIGGIAAGFVGGLWGRGWIWTALVLLIGMIAFMYARATTFFGEVRHAAGLQWWDFRRSYEPSAPDPVALDRLLGSSRPTELAIVGHVGLVLLIALMVFKPY